LQYTAAQCNTHNTHTTHTTLECCRGALKSNLLQLSATQGHTRNTRSTLACCGGARESNPLQYGATHATLTCCSIAQHSVCWCVLHYVAVCCSVLQCVAEPQRIVQHSASTATLACCRGASKSKHPYNVLQCVAVCCSVLQCVAVCCSVLQCVAVCCIRRAITVIAQITICK